MCLALAEYKTEMQFLLQIYITGFIEMLANIGFLVLVISSL